MTKNTSSTLRSRTFHFLETGLSQGGVSRFFTFLLIALIIANVVAVIIGTVPEIAVSWHTEFYIFELFSILIFTIEYLARAWSAPENAIYNRMSDWKARTHYVTRPSSLVDLAAIAPFLALLDAVDVHDFLILRIFTLVRFLKLARYSPSISSLFNALASERRALSGALIIMIGALLVFSTLEYLIERHAQPDKFGSIPQAMWWGIATLATVGYGDVTPITPLGKLVAGIAMFFGLGMFAIPFGIVATAFVREIQRREFVVTWAMVAKVPLFQDLNASEIAAVTELLEAHTVESGMYICHAGEEADCMYFIVAGDVEVLIPQVRSSGKGHPVSVPRIFGPGSYFGEAAVLSKTRRTATVKALSRTNLLTLAAEDLHYLMEKQPNLAVRIREAAEESQNAHLVRQGGDMTVEEMTPHGNGHLSD